MKHVANRASAGSRKLTLRTANQYPGLGERKNDGPGPGLPPSTALVNVLLYHTGAANMSQATLHSFKARAF